MTTTRVKTVPAQRHQEGLRHALDILTTQEPKDAYHALLRMVEAGQLDAELADHARALTKVDASTTAHLEMSHADLEIVLRCMTYAFEQLFGGLFVHDAIEDEGELGRLGDFAHALAVVADQAAEAACRYTQPTPPAPGFVKPSSVARLEAMRGEFSDDPQGIDTMLTIMHMLDKHADVVVDALRHTPETPDAAAAASPTPTPATPA